MCGRVEGEGWGGNEQKGRGDLGSERLGKSLTIRKDTLKNVNGIFQTDLKSQAKGNSYKKKSVRAIHTDREREREMIIS